MKLIIMPLDIFNTETEIRHYGCVDEESEVLN